MCYCDASCFRAIAKIPGIANTIAISVRVERCSGIQGKWLAHPCCSNVADRRDRALIDAIVVDALATLSEMLLFGVGSTMAGLGGGLHRQTYSSTG